MPLVRAYPREIQVLVFDAPTRAFAFCKGTCTRGIYDNMKTAVETVFIGKDRQFNRRFLRQNGRQGKSGGPVRGYIRGTIPEERRRPTRRPSP